MPTTPREFLTVAEVAERFRTTDGTVRVWAAAGCTIYGQVIVLESVMAGRRYLFTAAGCDRFLADCTAARDRAARAVYATGARRPDPAPAGDCGVAAALAALGHPP